MFCGGSSLVLNNENRIIVTDQKSARKWLNEMLELQVIAQIEPFYVFSGDQQNVEPNIWTKLAQLIKKNYSSYDGFIITHQLNSIVYAGSALSFMLQNLGKPVILTGYDDIQVKPAEKFKKLTRFSNETGMRANMINAVQVSTMDMAEVVIVSSNCILRATQSQRIMNLADIVPGSTGYLGKVDFGIKLSEDRQRRRKTSLALFPGLETNVYTLQIYPGMDVAAAIELIPSGTRGVFIKAQDILLRKKDIDALNQFGDERKTPVFIYQKTNNQPRSHVWLIYLPSMMTEAAIIKVMWSLGQTRSVPKLRDLLESNIANELFAER